MLMAGDTGPILNARRRPRHLPPPGSKPPGEDAGAPPGSPPRAPVCTWRSISQTGATTPRQPQQTRPPLPQPPRPASHRRAARRTPHASQGDRPVRHHNTPHQGCCFDRVTPPISGRVSSALRPVHSGLRKGLSRGGGMSQAQPVSARSGRRRIAPQALGRYGRWESPNTPSEDVRVHAMGFRCRRCCPTQRGSPASPPQLRPHHYSRPRGAAPTCWCHRWAAQSHRPAGSSGTSS